MKIEQFIAGREPPAGKMAYRETAERIHNLVLDYDFADLEEFLRGISHNFELQAHS